jgi:pimeloyl-ACP methyl ester carboxylesterase
MIDKTTTLGDQVVHYVDFGGQGRTIVLVHGLGGSHANWLAVAPALASFGRVVAIDLPGFGLSPRDPRGTSLEVMGESLSKFIDAMSPEPVHLIGNSMGGALSILEASRRPSRIQSVLLVCPALPPAPGTRPDPQLLSTLLLAFVPFGDRLLKRRAAKAGPRQMVHDLMKLCCVDASKVPPSVIEAHVDLATSRPSRNWADRSLMEATRSLSALLTFGSAYRRALKGLTIPALIVHGQLDRLVDVRSARAAVAMAPQIQLVELPGVGHTPQMEAADAFIALAERFFAQADSVRVQPGEGLRPEAS